MEKAMQNNTCRCGVVFHGIVPFFVRRCAVPRRITKRDIALFLDRVIEQIDTAKENRESSRTVRVSTDHTTALMLVGHRIEHVLYAARQFADQGAQQPKLLSIE